MSLDLGRLKPGDRLPWKGQTWIVEGWRDVPRKAREASMWAEGGRVMVTIPVHNQPTLVLRDEAGKRVRLSPFSEVAWARFSRDMESAWLRSRPSGMPGVWGRIGETIAVHLPARYVNRQPDAGAIARLPWIED